MRPRATGREGAEEKARDQSAAVATSRGRDREFNVADVDDHPIGCLEAEDLIFDRPSQLDRSIVPLFAVPNFPSYPSNHSTFSAERAEILAYLFPDRADFIRAVGKEAGDSRIWAGIHFEMDNVAGVKLGKSVAGVFINWAENDGSK